MARRLELLSRPLFRRLLGSYGINELGDVVGVLALTVLVYEQTKSAAATAALFIAAKLVPAFISPLLTARLDQLGLRRTLPSIYAVEAAVFTLLAFVADGRFVLAVVLALAIVDGSLALTARGLTRGSIGALLKPEGLLKQGNGLLNIVFAAASVGGAALAGLLIQQLGVSVALLADAGSFLIIAGVLAGTSGLPEAGLERQPWRDRMRGSLAFVRQNPVIRWLLIAESAALVFFTLVIPIEVIYARESLGSNSAGFGLLVAAWGAGIVVGSLLYVGLKNRRPYALILASTAAIGLAYCGMAVSETLLLACTFAVLGGIGNGIQWVAVMTSLQEATPVDLQARVVGLMESLNAAMPGVGFVLGAAIATLDSPRTAYAVAGIGVLVLTAVGVAATPFMRRGASRSTEADLVRPSSTLVFHQPGPPGPTLRTADSTREPPEPSPSDRDLLGTDRP